MGWKAHVCTLGWIAKLTLLPMQPLEAFKLGILGHGRALQSVGSPGDGSRSCEEWAGQERDKRASKSWSNGFIVQMAASCTHGTPAYKAPEKVCQTFRMMFHLKESKTCWAGQPLRLPSLGWIAHSGHGSRSNLLGWKALKKSKTCWAGQPLRLTSLIRKQSLELESLQESQRHMLGWTAFKTY